MSLPRIFVSIPAYRDRECQWTLRDMFERARHPERVFAGVCWQTVPGEDEDCFEIRPRPAQVRAVQFHASEARGLGWARGHAQSLWQGEEYSLQIDSHMRFVTGWDERMIDMLAACDSPNPVLTHYPVGYDPPDERQVSDTAFTMMIRRFIPDTVLLEFGAETVPQGVVVDRPLPTAGLAGGFIFGGSRILRDVPADPGIYFGGEEPSLAMRLWTWGFDLFSPHQSLLYHYYGRADGSRHWNDATATQSSSLHKATLHRMRLLCEPDAFAPEQVAALGPYGLGRQRTLAEYEAFAGVNFAARTISTQARQYPWVRVPAAGAAVAPADTLRPAPDTQLFVLGDEGVLFSEATGTLHRLNAAAARTWCALEAEHEWQRIAVDAAVARDVAVDTAMTELRDLAAHWTAAGLLRDAPAEVPNGPRLDASRFEGRSHDYRLMDLVIRVRCGDALLEQLVQDAFGHLEVPGAGIRPTVTLTAVTILNWTYLFDRERVLGVAGTTCKLVPLLKQETLGRAIQRQHHIMHLHSAAVKHAGRLILLPASSGSGKTVLTARLLSLGCIYYSDEAVLLRRDGTVRTAPSAMSIKADGVALLAPHFPALADLAAHDREDGVSVRYLPPPVERTAPPGLAERPGLIVFPKYIPDADVALRPVAPGDALARLLAECLAIPRRLDTDAVATIVELVETVPCWDLVTGDLDMAARQVLTLAERAGPAGGERAIRHAGGS